jgi:4,5-dihydroxyphthalate decarboxylase
MADLPIVLACDSPAFEPLWDGTVRLDGLDVTIVRGQQPGHRHRQMRERLAYDVCEYSSGNYLCACPLGLPFTAVPIFPLRLFRQRDIWVSRASGIEAPEQLQGRRIGIQMWSNSALVWQRALLQHDYGLDLASPRWVSNGADDPRFQLPTWVRLERCPPGRSLEQLLAAGEIDAMLLPHDPEFEPGDAAHVRRLFEDYVPVEQDYFARTGLFPPMHTVVVKNTLLAEHPWVAERVSEGLRRVLDAYVERHRQAGAESVVWPGLTWAEQQARLGPQPWPSGLAANRATLEAAIGYAHEQGVIAERFAPEALFTYDGRVLAGADH